MILRPKLRRSTPSPIAVSCAASIVPLLAERSPMVLSAPRSLIGIDAFFYIFLLFRGFLAFLSPAIRFMLAGSPIRVKVIFRRVCAAESMKYRTCNL